MPNSPQNFLLTATFTTRTYDAQVALRASDCQGDTIEDYTGFPQVCFVFVKNCLAETVDDRRRSVDDVR